MTSTLVLSSPAAAAAGEAADTATVPPAPVPSAPAGGSARRLLRGMLRALWWLLGIVVLLLALGIAALAALPALEANLLVITSGSMTPAIATGDAVVVVDTPPAEVETGDVIAFQGYTGEGLTTHRVLSHHDVDGRLHFRTKGDANATPDVDLAPADGMVGEVVFALPQAGRPLLFLAGPTARMLLLVVPGAVLVIVQARDLLGARRARRRRRPPATPRERPAPRGLPATRQSRARRPGWLLRQSAPTMLLILVLAALGVSHLALGGIGRAGAVLTDVSTIPDNSFATVDLVPPGNVTATFDCGTLGLGKGTLVDWDAVSDAEGYEVARSTTSGGPYSTVATVDASTTEYFDENVENSTTYYYVVRSTASGWLSEDSAEASETTPGSTDCLL